MATLRQAWVAYDASERRNIGIFILGLMFYKFGLEIFIGSIIPLASDRFGESFFDCDESRKGPSPPSHLEAFRKVGVLTGVNQAMQCLGSILVAPLMQRYQTRKVLLGATMVFALLASILIIVDAATGGRPRQWGGYNPVAIFPVYCISGIAYGMIELIRRVLPRELVGGDVSKLKRLDSAVHVFYETAGTIGPITAVKLIDSVGENLSFFLSPISLALAGIVWFFIRLTESQQEVALPADPAVEKAIPHTPAKEPGYLKGLSQHVAFWGRSTWNGGAIVLGERRFIWLIPCYSFALLAHRYLENNIGNIYAKGVIQKASYQSLVIVGSNLGELLGATTVFFTADVIHSPIPFVRLDGLFLLLAWFIPFLPVSGNTLNDALSMAALFMPMSYAWAAGDVSLNAFIQSNLINIESRKPGVSTLASIMSFLYVTYIASYTLLSSLLGLLVDTVLGGNDACGANFRSNTRTALIYVGGIFFTVTSFMILMSTLLPRGARALNPVLWDFQPPQQVEEPGNGHLGGPAGVNHVDRPDTPTPPRSPVSIDIDDSEAAGQRAQRQNISPPHIRLRPLPPIPSRPRGFHDAQRQNVLPSPTHPPPHTHPASHTHSAALLSPPLPTHRSRYP